MGRPTLANSIQSAVREGFPVIVVGDGIDIADSVKEKFAGCDVKFTRTGRKYGHYGVMGANMGVLLAETDYCIGLGDDDEYVEGSSQILLNKIKEHPDVDIWIPNVLFSPDQEWYKKKQVRYGFTPCPMIKTDVITQSPFLHPPHELLDHAIDYMMVETAVNVYGYKIDWINEVIIAIRPNYKGTYGAGSLGHIEFKMV